MTHIAWAMGRQFVGDALDKWHSGHGIFLPNERVEENGLSGLYNPPDDLMGVAPAIKQRLKG